VPVSFPHVARAGVYYRACGPEWKDPSDTTYSKISGGRWNPPGSFGVLYLNESIEGARANARRFIADQFGPNILPEDINPAYRPEVAEFTIADTAFVDAVTDAGRSALRLATRYATKTGYDACRRVGTAAYAAGEEGIATTSAVAERPEELAVSDRAVVRIVRFGRRRQFADWWTAANRS
jgi:RES domain-containing protein